MLTAEELRVLLRNPESTTLDFKQEQYKFYGGTKLQQSELLKDILAFANAWKTSTAYILIGAQEQASGPATLMNVADHLQDNDIQQFVNAKTNIPIHFLCGKIDAEGMEIGYIRIELDQERPVFLKKDFERLKKNVVYIRRGSSTDEADPTEIAEMGATAAKAVESPQLELEFADDEKREAMGQEIKFTTYKLTYQKPKPIRSPLDKFVEPLLSDLRSVEIPAFSSARYLEPDEGEVRRYHESTAAIATTSFVLTNTGNVPVNNLRVEFEIAHSEDLRVFDQGGYPDYPTTPLTAISALGNHGLPDIFVEKAGSKWVGSFDRRNLQPKASSFTEPQLHFRPYCDCGARVSVKVFADEIMTPLEFELLVGFEVIEKTYTDPE